ncbi:MAG: GAF and ANTAR domain-containing protein [Nocardioides sp.]|nr:GAF and ANTAR domain-containing protein [Nocardioides sp.]
MTTTEPPPEYDFPELLGSLHSLALSIDEVQTFLEEVARLAASLVEPPASCGITTHYDGRPATAATSDLRASLIDEVQYGAGDGPCLTAMRTGEVMEIRDLDNEERWPEFVTAARERGVRCILSMPLVVRGERRGALNIYGFERPEDFNEDEIARARVFAAQAATALSLTLRHIEQGEHATQLEGALQSRSVIDQAIGLLMGQQKCDADTAFALLRTHSQNNNRRLRDVARELIERQTGRPLSPTPTFRRSGDTVT